MSALRIIQAAFRRRRPIFDRETSGTLGLRPEGSGVTGSRRGAEAEATGGRARAAGRGAQGEEEWGDNIGRRSGCGGKKTRRGRRAPAGGGAEIGYPTRWFPR